MTLQKIENVNKKLNMSDNPVNLFNERDGKGPNYAYQKKVNTESVISSGVLMLGYINWQETADIIVKNLENTIIERAYYDFHKSMENASFLKGSNFW